MHRAPWFFLAVLLTAPHAGASDGSEGTATDADAQTIAVELEWQPLGEDATYRVYRNGGPIHTTGGTSHIDVLAADPVTGLFHAYYEVTAQGEAEEDEETVLQHIVASAPVCPPLLIATNLTIFPYLFASIDHACIPGTPDPTPVGTPVDAATRLFR